jgi:GNAT superfamily N-acetyltransferase
MNEGDPVVVSITSIPKSGLALLHLRYLPTPFSRLPGRRLLELYYDAMCQVDDAFGWAVVVDGHTAGFACAVRNMKSIQRALLARSHVRVLFWYCVQILCNPRMLMDLVGRLVPSRTDSAQWQRPAEWSEWYTYRPLVVDEGYRKYGLSDLLTRCLVAEAKKRGVPGLLGFVERSNSRSRVTHVRNGFREVWRGEEYVVFAREFGVDSTGEGRDLS